MAIIQNAGKVTYKDGVATINPHTLSLEQLVQLLQDEKCSGIEGVIVNGCEVTFRRLKNKGLDGFNS